MENPFLTQPIARRVSTLIGVYLAFMIVVADATGFGTILPAAVAELGGGQLYGLTTAIAGILGVVVMPVFGWITARSPHLRPYLLGGGIALVAGMMVLRSVAPDMTWILIAKVFESAGGTAACYVIGIPLVRDMFQAHRIGILLGVISTTTAIGTTAGPITVGVIIDNWGWRQVGFIFAAVAAVAAILVLAGARPAKKDTVAYVQNTGRLDVLGAVVLTVFIACLIFPISLGTGLVPFGSALNTAFLVAAALAFVALVVIERRLKDNAIIPTSTLRDRNTVMFALQTFLSQGSSLAVLIFVPYFILGVMKAPATEAGIAAAIYSVPAFFLGPLVGRWIAKTGSVKGIIYLSSVFKIGSLIVLVALMLTQGAAISVWAIYACMLVSGIYQGLNQPVVQAGPTLLLPADLRVRGNATIQMSISLGPMIFAAVFGSVVVGVGLMPGVPIALIVAAVASVFVVIPTSLMRRRPPVEEQEAEQQPGEVLAAR